MSTPSLLRALWPLYFFALASCSITHAIRTENNQRIDVEQMIAEVRDAPLLFVGERHDSTAHHVLQLDVIKGLQQTGRPLAIGIEMFEIQNQAALDAWIARKTSEAEFVRIYQANWRNLSWWLYRDIFVFARDHGIAMIALNAPREIVQKVARQGFAGLSSSDLLGLPPESTRPIRDDDVDFMTRYFPGHGRDGAAAYHLAEAQVLRNRVMAKGILRYLGRHPDSRLLVLTGGVHAWGKGGIPGELGGQPYKIIVPPIPGLEVGAGATAGADYLLD